MLYLFYYTINFVKRMRIKWCFQISCQIKFVSGMSPQISGAGLKTKKPPRGIGTVLEELFNMVLTFAFFEIFHHVN